MPVRHTIRAGECIESIALHYGFFAATLWDHPENAGLRELRDNPHVLEPGDVLFIPDKQTKKVRIATGRRHVFRRRGVPAKFRVVLEREGEPRADLAYTLSFRGQESSGVTGSDGVVEAWIPPDLEVAELRIGDAESYHFDLGRLLPVATEEGFRTRMTNLGYNLPTRDDDEPEAFHARRLRAAVRRFQRDYGIEVTGAIDEATQRALIDAHGS
ncbi:MAG TPA: peptidoglycan-binding protein [Thermoanaerobaculia bacterium]|nr:peptidoglycan-binding protein [Thermoanaerobaculia bacterium]